MSALPMPARVRSLALAGARKRVREECISLALLAAELDRLGLHTDAQWIRALLDVLPAIDKRIDTEQEGARP